ncbi:MULTISPECIES: NAD(P)H-dependent oxidoreductase [unclassified Mucilaginibacter]|uniref:NAD(P)H-dependent oxidoreductase n=1 Tax=unclassified Mucilaginibacter TaxID=2617802 RepID=UPI003394604A
MGKSYNLNSSRFVGCIPAIMKGFIDRLFLDGMAFQYRTISIFWNKFLKGKTAHIITILDQPSC